MPDVELILALMVVVAVVAAAAHALRLPYSILLVLVGLLLALTPGIPQVAFAPELIFLLFLPPPVYVAGFGISPRDIKAQLRDAAPHWRETLVVGWSGLRGVVSLAAALALPLSTSGRDELLFITFGVILVTLIGQGLTLRPLTRWLRVGADGSSDREESHARTVAADAAVARLGELATEWPGHMPLIDTLRAQYTHRATHLGEVRSGDEPSDGTSADAAAEQELLEHRLIRRAVIDAERGALLDLRDTGAIDDEVWRRIERDLDLEELRMEA